MKALLSVVTLALLTAGCHTYIPAPLAPSPVVAVVTPTPTPAPDLAPLSVSLSIGRSDLEVGDGVSFTASAGSAITRADWAFGNGSTASSTTGDAGYAYPAPGTFVVRVTVIVSDGRTGSAQQTVTVRRKTPTPTPAPTPTPQPNTNGLEASVACRPTPTGGATPCQTAVTYNGVAQPSATITQVRWDFGDGEVSTIAGPVTSHVYWGAGSYTVFATVTANLPTPPGGSATKTVTTAITIP